MLILILNEMAEAMEITVLMPSEDRTLLLVGLFTAFWDRLFGNITAAVATFVCESGSL